MIKQRLHKLIEPAVTALGYELVDVKLIQGARRNTVQIFIDGEKGVPIEACVAVSRQVNAVFEVEEPLQGNYNLEVSSPGLDRPLVTPAHFQRFVGRKIKLRLRVGREDRRNFSGTLTTVAEDKVTVVMDDGQEETFLFNDIDKANLIPEL